jgi:hypothetical protein
MPSSNFSHWGSGEEVINILMMTEMVSYTDYKQHYHWSTHLLVKWPIAFNLMCINKTGPSHSHKCAYYMVSVFLDLTIPERMCSGCNQVHQEK